MALTWEFCSYGLPRVWVFLLRSRTAYPAANTTVRSENILDTERTVAQLCGTLLGIPAVRRLSTLCPGTASSSRQGER
jgi:hypothetical protein